MTRFDGGPTAPLPTPGAWTPVGGSGAATTGPTTDGAGLPLHGARDDGFREALAAALATGYAIEYELESGAMARVFAAREVALDRRVVIKVLPPELAAGVNRERFRREIQLAAQLQHPHVVPLLAAGEVAAPPVPATGETGAGSAAGSLYYTMPFIEGESLRAELASRAARGERFTPREVLRILTDIADALGYAHARGVVHRDVKPGNVLLQHGHALVTDFGVAKALAASGSSTPGATMTVLGMAIGTPAYMAPEQLAADPAADHRMDLYAAGLVAYELLSGVSPFAAASPQATLAAQLTRVPADIATVRPDVPPALAAVIMQCLAKEPDERPATATALLEALEGVGDVPGRSAWHSGSTRASVTAASAATASLPATGAAAVRTGPMPARRSRRRGLLVAAAVMVASGGAWLARSGGHAAPRAGVTAASVSTPAVPTPPVPAVAPSVGTAAGGITLSRSDSAAIAAAVEREFRRAAARPTAIAESRASGRAPITTARESAAYGRAARATVIDSLVRFGDRWSRYSPDVVRSVIGKLPVELAMRARTGRRPSADELRELQRMGTGMIPGLEFEPGTPASPTGPSGVVEAPGVRARTGAFAGLAAALPPVPAGARRIVPVLMRDGTGRADLAAMAPLVDAALRAQLQSQGRFDLTDMGLGAVARREHVSDREIARTTGAAAVLHGTITATADRVQAVLLVYDTRRGYPTVVHADAPIAGAPTAPALAQAIAGPLARAVVAALDGAPDAGAVGTP